ncbi:heavy-metal-associated domain-containing protein [Antribacter gilvus]|uniref:heavy-metal-associated domain-containing protein n=1 Tax=Antribacter gilvus TaxID=2304675 RepID=UPI000F799DC9|nr:heavy-metal-associated domain-containing protein [Antribacter gilvus]
MTTITTLAVDGMTCGHCVSSVTQELRGVSDVQDVSVELHAGATSLVRVVSEQPLPETPLREAVDEAGYSVASVDVLENAVEAEASAQAPAKQALRTLPIVQA